MRQKKMIIAALAAMLLAIPAMVQSKKGEAAKRAQTLAISVRLALVPTNTPSGLRMRRATLLRRSSSHHTLRKAAPVVVSNPSVAILYARHVCRHG